MFTHAVPRWGTQNGSSIGKVFSDPLGHALDTLRTLKAQHHRAITVASIDQFCRRVVRRGVGPTYLHKRCHFCISARRGFGAGAWTVEHVPYREAARWWAEMCDSLKDRDECLRILF